MYYRIIPFLWSFDTYGLLYKYKEELVIWSIVCIPLRKKEEYGIVAEALELKQEDLNLSEIRQIQAVISDFQFLSSKQIQVVDFITNFYITPVHNALWLFFPKNLLEKIKKWTLSKIKTQEYNYPQKDIELSEKQNQLFESFSQSRKNKHLIYWVTWSWKTQIYMKVISQNIKNEKQTLLLIPEIILTSQIWERMKNFFWDEVIILHSWVSAAKKSQYWMDIYEWNAKIIIGTRSALFFPYNNLWWIIIDEEHDESYISDNAPRYHSLEVAEKISDLYNVPLILWTWTPKITTFYKSLTWEYELYQLLEKYK